MKPANRSQKLMAEELKLRGPTGQQIVREEIIEPNISNMTPKPTFKRERSNPLTGQNGLD